MFSLQQTIGSAAQISLALLVDLDGYDISEKSEVENGTLPQAEAVVDVSEDMANVRVQDAIFMYHCICMYVCFCLLSSIECSVMFNIAEITGCLEKEKSNSQET